MSADISSTVSPEGMWETSWRKILWKPDQTKIELLAIIINVKHSTSSEHNILTGKHGGGCFSAADPGRRARVKRKQMNAVK